MLLIPTCTPLNPPPAGGLLFHPHGGSQDGELRWYATVQFSPRLRGELEGVSLGLDQQLLSKSCQDGCRLNALCVYLLSISSLTNSAA